eukprot:CAMPEP_0196591872 /NCGR_PEP_ID=MMETSP1081-20130531/71159_1 /TAXON_ID=36882 /ORGANISM="Pyramimonas amylifera, Strain CCMP720" /LENGTH=44 /DNA_ID= /DNA_START= /DNA_END= /DNA_ORIENTATION=
MSTILRLRRTVSTSRYVSTTPAGQGAAPPLLLCPVNSLSPASSA